MLAKTLSHGRAHNTDPDYEEFFGKPREAEVYDWRTRRWRRCILRAPKTPADKVPPANPDKLIAEDNPYIPRKEKTYRRVDTPQNWERIQAWLQVEPLDTRQIADRLGANPIPVSAMLRRKSELVCLGRSAGGFIYGLADHHYYKQHLPDRVKRVVEYLMEHGPSTVAQIANGTGLGKPRVNDVVSSRRDVLHPVGYSSVYGQRVGVRLWGVVGVHDTQTQAA